MIKEGRRDDIGWDMSELEEFLSSGKEYEPVVCITARDDPDIAGVTVPVSTNGTVRPIIPIPDQLPWDTAPKWFEFVEPKTAKCSPFVSTLSPGTPPLTDRADERNYP